MFTGIIEGTGVVKKIKKSVRSARLTVGGGKVLSGLSRGESVSVNGACLTVVEFSKTGFSADVSDETLRRTTLGALREGDPLNLERAAKFSDRIGGHLVSGHVDGVGVIRKIEPVGDSFLFFIGLNKDLLRYCIEKGSIAIDGISLTINRTNRRGIFLMIIPHTMKATTLGRKNEGDPVNVENDLVGKYVERFVQLK
ncbi:MAG: riboflavin synthase [Nitrospirae bacterium]|nr:riboflavin synthase [Nitrospirota bacterium]